MSNNMIEIAKITWPEYFEVNKSIKLGNGETLIRRYEKYQPAMCFLLTENNIDQHWLDVTYHGIDINATFDAKKVEWMPGEFWVSKKGTPCFRPKEDGSHILIRTTWGGCFEPSRGTEFPELKEKALFSKYARSNGGGAGYNYYVFPKDFRNEVSLDDI